MGYTTRFKGDLLFTNPMSEEALYKISTFFDEDVRDHKEWETEEYANYIDLEFNKDRTGICWNGAEKTYGMISVVNLIIREMQKEFPDFGLSGKFLCAGEDIDDIYEIVIENNKAIERKLF